MINFWSLGFVTGRWCLPSERIFRNNIRPLIYSRIKNWWLDLLSIHINCCIYFLCLSYYFASIVNYEIFQTGFYTKVNSRLQMLSFLFPSINVDIYMKIIARYRLQKKYTSILFADTFWIYAQKKKVYETYKNRVISSFQKIVVEN